MENLKTYKVILATAWTVVSASIITLFISLIP